MVLPEHVIEKAETEREDSSPSKRKQDGRIDATCEGHPDDREEPSGEDGCAPKKADPFRVDLRLPRIVAGADPQPGPPRDGNEPEADHERRTSGQ